MLRRYNLNVGIDDSIRGNESKLHLLKDQMDYIENVYNKTLQRLCSEIDNFKNKTNKIINFIKIKISTIS